MSANESEQRWSNDTRRASNWRYGGGEDFVMNGKVIDGFTIKLCERECINSVACSIVMAGGVHSNQMAFIFILYCTENRKQPEG